MYRIDLPWWLPGAALLVSGLLIVIYPELLALLVASAFVFAGTGLLMAGWAARRYRQQMRRRYQRDEYHWFI